MLRHSWTKGEREGTDRCVRCAILRRSEARKRGPIFSAQGFTLYLPHGCLEWTEKRPKCSDPGQIGLFSGMPDEEHEIPAKPTAPLPLEEPPTNVVSFPATKIQKTAWLRVEVAKPCPSGGLSPDAFARAGFELLWDIEACEDIEITLFHPAGGSLGNTRKLKKPSEVAGEVRTLVRMIGTVRGMRIEVRNRTKGKKMSRKHDGEKWEAWR